MKKILFMAAVAIFSMTSCSDDSNSNTDNNNINNPSGTVLLKKSIHHYSDGTVNTSTFNYTAGKLSTITDTDGYTETYTYNGLNQIIKIQHAGPGNFDQKDVFSYDDNGRLIQYIRTSAHSNSGRKFTFTYNADNTITRLTFNGNATAQLSQTENNDVITYTNGNVLNINNRLFWTYNDKWDSWDAIPGYSILSVAFGDGGVNGTTSYKQMNLATGQPQEHYTYTFTYNNGSNYPATEVEHNVLSGEDTTVEYFYE